MTSRVNALRADVSFKKEQLFLVHCITEQQLLALSHCSFEALPSVGGKPSIHKLFLLFWGFSDTWNKRSKKVNAGKALQKSQLSSPSLLYFFSFPTCCSQCSSFIWIVSATGGWWCSSSDFSSDLHPLTCIIPPFLCIWVVDRLLKWVCRCPGYTSFIGSDLPDYSGHVFQSCGSCSVAGKGGIIIYYIYIIIYYLIYYLK